MATSIANPTMLSQVGRNGGLYNIEYGNRGFKMAGFDDMTMRDRQQVVARAQNGVRQELANITTGHHMKFERTAIQHVSPASIAPVVAGDELHIMTRTPQPGAAAAIINNAATATDLTDAVKYSTTQVDVEVKMRVGKQLLSQPMSFFVNDADGSVVATVDHLKGDAGSDLSTRLAKMATDAGGIVSKMMKHLVG